MSSSPIKVGFTTRRRLLLSTTLAFIGMALTACGEDSRTSFHGIEMSERASVIDFKLLGPGNHPYTMASFRGKAVLLFFGFTQCPDVCPTALSRAVEIKRLLGQDGAHLQMVFVTLDPERDTPAILSAYTSAFDPTFLGLHGDSQRTAEAAKALKVFYHKLPTGSSYTLDHSAYSYAFDPQGRFRLALRHDQPAAEYAQDLRQLLRPL